MKPSLVSYSLILLVSLSLGITGCTDGGSDENKVNLIGTWNYSMTWENSVCDGFLAIGTTTILSLNGDLSKIGDITRQGEFLSIDGNNCTVLTVNETDIDERGEPSTLTKSEYLTSLEEGTSGDSSIRLDSYTNNQITVVMVIASDESVITSTLTR